MKFNDEHFRGTVHAVAGGLAATLTMYQFMRLSEADAKSKVRHTINAIIYATFWGYEVYQTHYHWAKLTKERRDNA